MTLSNTFSLKSFKFQPETFLGHWYDMPQQKITTGHITFFCPKFISYPRQLSSVEQRMLL